MRPCRATVAHVHSVPHRFSPNIDRYNEVWMEEQGVNAEEKQSASAGSPIQGRRRKILVVDDSRTILLTATRLLVDAQVEVVTAKDGYEAVKAMYDHEPDLVFVDVMMPRIDGYHFCSVVKNNLAFATTPVIMLTSKDGLIDKARAKLVRADGYLIKPFTKASMSEILAVHLP